MPSVVSSRVPQALHMRIAAQYRWMPSTAPPRATTSMTITLYGIPNCDTVKKARTWLTENGHAFDFHDFKKQGLDSATVADWLTQVDWQTLVNRKGTTWRKLGDEQKEAVIDNASAQALMLATPSVVKRPVLSRDGKFSVGFSDAQFHQLFSS